VQIFHGQAHTAVFENVRSTFAGEAELCPVAELSTPCHDHVSLVTFEANARTHWHEHEAGQVLVVIRGQGYVAVQGGETATLTEGDVVIAEPGEVHWHGAGAESQLAHIAVSRGVTTWHGPVEAD